jgi:multidrug efflux pump subunit AcrA (membrane-fusion protein)
MKKKLFIAGSLSLLTLLFVWLFFFRGKNVQYETIAVEKKDLVQTVSVTGELKSDIELNVNFQTTGRIKKVYTYIGQVVAGGDILAEIDDNILNQQVSNSKALLDRALAQAGISDDEINRLEELLNNTKKAFSDTEDLEKQKVDAAKQAVVDAQRNYDDTKEYYQLIVAENGADSVTAKNAKLTLNNSLTSLNSAKESKNTAEKLEELNVTAAKNNVKQAEENLIKLKSDNQQLYDNANIASAKAQYEIALQNLDQAILRAPVSGRISRVNYKAGEVLGTASALLSSGDLPASGPFAKLISADFLIEANVPESDIAKIKLNNKGTVNFDAFSPDEKFEVQVVDIEPAATVIQDVVYYKVKFKLEGDNDVRIKPGMTANVDVETARKNTALVIPERLVIDENGSRAVQILDPVTKQSTKVSIKLGTRGDEGMIEVLDGLKEGDLLIAGEQNN